MLEDFIELVRQLFPAINPYVAEKAKKILHQFKELDKFGEPVIVKGRQKYKNIKWFLDKPLGYLAQGDVIGDFNFKFIDCDGYEREFETSGMLLSNTCDAARDENIILAPLIPFDTEKLKAERINEYDLFNNKIFQILYYPNCDEPCDDLSNYFIDLSIINTFPRELVMKKIEERKIMKKSSLSDFGYYLFLSKLTLRLMRPEDPETQKERKVYSDEGVFSR